MDEIYHVFNKSIAGFRIFNDSCEFTRMIYTIRYYQKEKPIIKFSQFLRFHKDNIETDIACAQKDKLVEIIAYCIMPTHLHFILMPLKEKSISSFMGNILNSYTRYFNIKYNRKGPLWEARSKKVIIKTDEQLLHLTRYIHLNPVTAYLVDKPENWPASSYREYLLTDDNNKICNYATKLKIEPISYQRFVEDVISYQRKLAKIRKLVLE